MQFGEERETREFKGFGRIEFEETEATDEAVVMAGTDFLVQAVCADFIGDKGKNFGGDGGGRGGR
eukprot:5473922-Ditylum_brightwellii.AAC.1